METPGRGARPRRARQAAAGGAQPRLPLSGWCSGLSQGLEAPLTTSRDLAPGKLSYPSHSVTVT
ncbi:hypothetical protein Acy02nite_10970 [Actinoplanes cyaneus]|uniref:Uncharacterized protein n=1 Tax=Actinoplanes cyaneus TaxID=52696 RepID=A0A919M9N5_9ACTN|nr:hypothetical protein Acy02nite_10970 [Actinoplanes cyaneus]